MTEYLSKMFRIGEEFVNKEDQATAKIDQWLMSLCKTGYGTNVVGYQAIGLMVLITVKRWKLGERLPGQSLPARPQPTVIDEEFDTPSIDIGAEEEPNNNGHE